MSTDNFNPYCPRCGACGEPLCCDGSQCDGEGECQYPDVYASDEAQPEAKTEGS